MTVQNEVERLHQRFNPFIPFPPPPPNAWHPSREEGKTAFAKAFGMEYNPKFDTAFKIAWDYGRHDGWSEVLAIYNDLVELIR